MKTIAIWITVVLAGAALGQVYLWWRVKRRRKKNGQP